MIRQSITAIFVILYQPVTAQSSCICLQCLTGPYDRYALVSGHMKSTLEPGQCVIMRTDFDTIPAGAIITHLQDDVVHIRRVIALAGQTVQMRAGRLFIDNSEVLQTPVALYRQVMEYEGDSLPRCPQETPLGDTCDISRLRETIGDFTYDVLNLGQSVLDDTPVFLVPDGHIFVLGDNRDNSTDSRISKEQRGPGFVALSDVTGILDEIRK